MRECHHLDKYLDQSLPAEELSRFEQHLNGCANCQADLQDWQAAEQHLALWANTATGRQPSATDAATLVAKAQTSLEPVQVVHHIRRNVAWGLVATAAAAAVALVIWQPFGPSAIEGPDSSRAPVASNLPSAPVPAGTIIEALDDTEFRRFGLDRVAVIQNSKARVVELAEHKTMVALNTGTAVFDVAPINNENRFIVHAGPVDVHVKGTAFSVTVHTDEHVSVVVAEGLVEVHKGGQVLAVGAGQKWSTHTPSPGAAVISAPNPDVELIEKTLSLGDKPKSAKAIRKPRRNKQHTSKAAAEPTDTGAKEPKSKQVNYDEWRRQIGSGQHQDAARAISKHLKSKGSDHKAWSLLADAQRKGKNWKRAVDSYGQVVNHTSGTTANRARYMAADIYQKRLGDHSAAAKLLESYLQSAPKSGSQYNIAKVQLARSLSKLGQKQKAIAHLNDVLAGNPSSFVASNAKTLLSELQGQ